MSDALREHVAAMRWRDQNRRRLQLIAKKMNGPLSAEEEEEFQRLQALACERAAPFDRLLQTSAHLRREEAPLSEESAP
jgi:hypothetical protein